MKQLIEKMKNLFSDKKIVRKSVSECYLCGGCNFENMGKDKVCKGCGAVY